MSSTANRNYLATFILDNRGKEETVEQIVEVVKTEIAAVSGTVASVENVGRKDFARVTDTKFPAASYVQIKFSGPTSSPAALKERLRLKHAIYRTLVESV
ncbi:MAG: 30S ribosomal protein S6 [Opitutaceae bacterium]|jgi:small subunit ribosomal protein S6|nr:30S ribosomal protein S6 [Opitutaceae bacterium]